MAAELRACFLRLDEPLIAMCTIYALAGHDHVFGPNPSSGATIGEVRSDGEPAAEVPALTHVGDAEPVCRPFVDLIAPPDSAREVKVQLTKAALLA